MDFNLTEEHKMFQAMVRDFAAREIAPVAARFDEQAEFPAENIGKMAKLGLLGVAIDESYGGSGGDHLQVIIAGEEISRADAAHGVIFLVTLELATLTIYRSGTEEQKRRFVPPLARGDRLGCFALTEPTAGSDVASLETTATRKGDKYVLNGTKVFITNGGEAQTIVVFATMDRSLRHKGITAFIVEKDTPGFSVGKLEHKLGIRASSTAELVFDNCQVPEEQRLGREGEGFKIALETLDDGRIGIAAQALGIAQAAYEAALSYAQERRQFGQPIFDFQAIQFMLADMATKISAARLLTYRSAWLMDSGLPFVKEASMAKLFAAETAMWVATKAVQIHGGYGYVTGYPVERYFRDAKVTEIYEGTSEMQRLTIARHIAKSPQ